MSLQAFGVILLLTLSLSGQFVTAGHFCYLNPACDPDSEEWPGICHTGHNQSPIDLPNDETSIQSAKENTRPLLFNDGYVFDSYFIQNNGHSVQISFSPNLNSSAEMSGFGFSQPYILAQIHFHWGDDLQEGSEHTLSGKHHPMELHLVHYNSKYASFAKAAEADDAKSLAVLGLFLDPVDYSESDAKDFDQVTAKVPLKFDEKSVKVEEPLDLRPFLPEPGKMFYRYLGSLTTPGCNEDVLWTVVAEPVKVPRSIYDRLQDVDDLEDHKVQKNFRHVMPLDGRTIEIYTSKGIISRQSSSLVLTWIAILSLIARLS